MAESGLEHALNRLAKPLLIATLCVTAAYVAKNHQNVYDGMVRAKNIAVQHAHSLSFQAESISRSYLR